MTTKVEWEDLFAMRSRVFPKPIFRTFCNVFIYMLVGSSIEIQKQKKWEI